MQIETIPQMSTPNLQVCSLYCKFCRAYRYHRYLEKVAENICWEPPVCYVNTDCDYIDCTIECLKCHKVTEIETKKKE